MPATTKTPPQLFDIQPIPYFPAIPGTIWWLAAVLILIAAAVWIHRRPRIGITTASTTNLIRSTRMALNSASDSEARNQLARICSQLRREGNFTDGVGQTLTLLDHARFAPTVDRDGALAALTQLEAHLHEAKKEATDASPLRGAV